MPLIGALSVLVTGVCSLGVIAALHVSPVPLLENRPPPEAEVLSFAWQPPAPAPIKTPQRPGQAADAVVSETLQSSVFAGYQQLGPLERAIYGGPYAATCDVPTHATAGAFRRARSDRTAVSAAVTAHSPGSAPQAVAQMRASLASCAQAAVTSASTPAGNGFVAAGSRTSWAVWSRGDLVLSTTAVGPDAVLAAQRLASRVDGAAMRALKETCADLAPAYDAEARDPYQPYRSYQPLTVAEQLHVGPPPQSRAPFARPKTTDLEWSLPGAQEVPELAAVTLDEDWEPGMPVPTLEESLRDAPPMLVVPEGLQTPADSPAPLPPLALFQDPETVAHFAAPLVDEQGPGCGWSFLSYTASEQDDEQIEAAARTAAEHAYAALTKQVADWLSAVADHSVATARHAHAHMQWEQTQAVLTQVAAVQAAWDAAVANFETSVAELARRRQINEDLLIPEPEPTTPMPTRQPTPTPTQGVPSPSPSPTTPEPTPTDPTPLPPQPTQGTEQ